MTVPTNGFISYAHDGHGRLREFRKQLWATEKQFGIAFWADTSLTAGQAWSDEIASHIAAAHIFILLVSETSLRSHYIYSVEIPAIEARCTVVKGLIIPVVLRRCAWGLGVRSTQAVPTDRGRIRPIDDWSPRNNGYNCAREQIDAAIAYHYGVPLRGAA